MGPTSAHHRRPVWPFPRVRQAEAVFVAMHWICLVKPREVASLIFETIKI